MGVVTAAGFVIGQLTSITVLIQLLTVVTVLVQALAQILALTVLRRRQPDLRRPYRMFLYPLPSIIAALGWVVIYGYADKNAPGLHPIELSLLGWPWAAAPSLLWARASGEWPFGPKHIEEQYLQCRPPAARVRRRRPPLPRSPGRRAGRDRSGCARHRHRRHQDLPLRDRCLRRGPRLGRIATRSDDGASVVVDRLAAAAAALIEVCAPTAVPGCAAWASRPPEWSGPTGCGWPRTTRLGRLSRLSSTVRDRLGLDAVEADNDAKAATAAEAQLGCARGGRDGMLLNLGTGYLGRRRSPVVRCSGARTAPPWRSPTRFLPTVRSPVSSDGRAPAGGHLLRGRGCRRRRPRCSAGRTGTDEVFAAMCPAPGTRVSQRTSRPATADRSPGSANGPWTMAARAVANLAVALDPEIIALSGGHAPLGRLRSCPRLWRRWPSSCPSRRGWSWRASPSTPLSPGACLLAFRAAALPAPETSRHRRAGRSQPRGVR